MSTTKVKQNIYEDGSGVFLDVQKNGHRFYHRFSYSNMFHPDLKLVYIEELGYMKERFLEDHEE